MKVSHTDQQTQTRIDSLAKRVAELEDEVAKLTVVTIGALSALSTKSVAAPAVFRGLLDIIAPVTSESEESA